MASVNWDKIPASACVESKRTHYVAHVGRKQLLVTWSSFDAKQAQAALWARSGSGENARKCHPIMAKQYPFDGKRKRKR